MVRGSTKNFARAAGAGGRFTSSRIIRERSSGLPAPSTSDSNTKRLAQIPAAHGRDMVLQEESGKRRRGCCITERAGMTPDREDLLLRIQSISGAVLTSTL